VIEFAGATPPQEEVAAIAALLATAYAAAEPQATTAEVASPWKMSGRDYADWSDRCSTRF
jgi:hypothetical protein